jgi:hypothetical protein
VPPLPLRSLLHSRPPNALTNISSYDSFSLSHAASVILASGGLPLYAITLTQRWRRTSSAPSTYPLRYSSPRVSMLTRASCPPLRCLTTQHCTMWSFMPRCKALCVLRVSLPCCAEHFPMMARPHCLLLHCWLSDWSASYLNRAMLDAWTRYSSLEMSTS